MKLDRNINGTGRGKYGLIKTRRLHEVVEAGKAVAGTPADKVGPLEQVVWNNAKKALEAIQTLELMGIIEWGEPGTEGEFFVIKLRDEFANPALVAYSWAVIERGGDREYAQEVAELAYRSGSQSPFCKKPD